MKLNKYLPLIFLVFHLSYGFDDLDLYEDDESNEIEGIEDLEDSYEYDGGIDYPEHSIRSKGAATKNLSCVMNKTKTANFRRCSKGNKYCLKPNSVIIKTCTKRPGISFDKIYYEFNTSEMITYFTRRNNRRCKDFFGNDDVGKEKNRLETCLSEL